MLGSTTNVSVLMPVLLLAMVASAEPSSVPTALSSAQAHGDLELAITALEAALPDIHWHQSPAQWNQAKAQARAELAGVEDVRSFYALLRRLVSHIGEGHLTLERSEALIQQERESGRLFPLDLHFSDEGIFVIRGHGDAADIPLGTRLLSINDEAPEALLREAMTADGTDGNIPTEAMRSASGHGYALFRYRLRGPESTFQLRLRTAEGAEVNRTVDPVPYTARPPPIRDGAPSRPELQRLDGDIAYLSVPTFSNKRMRAAGIDYAATLHGIFEQLDRQRPKALILDLRENGGGSEGNETLLFSYLVAAPLRRYAAVEAHGPRISVSGPNGQRYETEVYDAEEMRTQRRGPRGLLLRRNQPPEGLMSHWSPVAPVYQGKLVVLAGGNTFSGAAELSSMLFHTRRAVFVGEEVGGGDAGNTSGYKWQLTLPGSGLRLGVPLLRFRFNWQPVRPGRGVFPHCPVPPRVEELGQTRDAAWRVALQLAAGNGSTPRGARCPPP